MFKITTPSLMQASHLRCMGDLLIVKIPGIPRTSPETETQRVKKLPEHGPSSVSQYIVTAFFSVSKHNKYIFLILFVLYLSCVSCSHYRTRKTFPTMRSYVIFHNLSALCLSWNFVTWNTLYIVKDFPTQREYISCFHTMNEIFK